MESVKKPMYPNLRAEIARCGDTLKLLGEYLGLSEPSIQRRLSGTIEWSIDEIELLCKRYQKPFEILFAKE